jgi:hypothetical protein
MRLVLALPVLLLACTLHAAAQPRLEPVDEAASVPDFFVFRARLQAAIARRDVDAVRSALSKDVKLSFGGHGGLEDFEKLWNPRAADSRLWETLAATLALGGTFAPDGSFTAPYVFARWPEDEDPFSRMAVIGSGVRVRSGPAASGSILAALDFSIVGISGPAAAGSAWVKVILPDGRTGFVDSRFLRSAIDYRVRFSRLDGRWQIVLFLAGD